MLSDEDAAAIGMNGSEKYGTFVTPKMIACCVRDWYETRIDDGTLKIVSNTEKTIDRFIEYADKNPEEVRAAMYKVNKEHDDRFQAWKGELSEKARSRILEELADQTLERHFHGEGAQEFLLEQECYCLGRELHALKNAK